MEWYRHSEVLDREIGTVFNVKTTNTTKQSTQRCLHACQVACTSVLRQIYKRRAVVAHTHTHGWGRGEITADHGDDGEQGGDGNDDEDGGDKDYGNPGENGNGSTGQNGGRGGRGEGTRRTLGNEERPGSPVEKGVEKTKNFEPGDAQRKTPRDAPPDSIASRIANRYKVGDRLSSEEFFRNRCTPCLRETKNLCLSIAFLLMGPHQEAPALSDVLLCFYPRKADVFSLVNR